MLEIFLNIIFLPVAIAAIGFSLLLILAFGKAFINIFKRKR